MKNILLSVGLHSLLRMRRSYAFFIFVLMKSYNYSSPADCYRSPFQLVLTVNGIYQLLTGKWFWNWENRTQKSGTEKIQSHLILFSRRFQKWCLPGFSQSFTFIGRYSPFLMQIGFIANENNGNALLQRKLIWMEQKSNRKFFDFLLRFTHYVQ